MRSHQADEAALEQWKPLIHKMAHKAARRAAGIGVPLRQDDFEQELRIVVLRCHDSFNPELGVKMITFLHRAMYNEINKLLNRDQRNVQHGFKVSGDTTWNGDDGQGESAWDYVEDDQERSPEHTAQDDDLITWINARVEAEAQIILEILRSGNQFVTNQLYAYNEGVAEEALMGGMRRIPLNLDFAFVCKLLGFNTIKRERLEQQIKTAIASYGT